MATNAVQSTIGGMIPRIDIVMLMAGASVVIGLAILIYLGWRWYDKRRYNIEMLIDEQAGQGVIGKKDYGRMWKLPDGSVKFRLWKQKMETKPFSFKHISADAVTAQKWVHCAQFSKDDIRPIEYLPTGEIAAVDEGQKTFLSGYIREVNNTYGATGWEKYAQTINIILIMVGIVITTFMLGKSMEKISSDLMAGFAAISKSQGDNIRVLAQVSQINEQLAEKLGITITNASVAVPPIG